MTRPSGAARWERLQATLAEAGIEARVDSRRYQHGYRPQFGTTRSIAIPLRDPGWTVEIADRWWSKNTDKWIGYEVFVVDGDSIVVRSWPLTKKRSEVREAVKAAIAQHGARSPADA